MRSRCCLIGIAVAAAFVAGGPALALDVRQIDIPQRAGVSIEPAHKDHVLTEPNRVFVLRRQSARWFVFEPEREVALLPEEEAALRREEEEAHAQEVAQRAADAARAEAERHPSTSVYFDFNRVLPTSGSTEFSAILAKGKSLSSIVKVIGHADEAGSDLYNMRLSQRRAVWVARALVKAGIPNANVLVTWVGKRSPVDVADAAKNRVVEVHVIRTAEDPQ
jgi:OOP family OmpA-OmpF porin